MALVVFQCISGIILTNQSEYNPLRTALLLVVLKIILAAHNGKNISPKIGVCADSVLGAIGICVSLSHRNSS